MQKGSRIKLSLFLRNDTKIYRFTRKSRNLAKVQQKRSHDFQLMNFKRLSDVHFFLLKSERTVHLDVL